MRITLEPTDQIVTINGKVQARVWNGTTDNGIHVQALVTRIACATEDHDECERLASELSEQPAPYTGPRAFDARLFLD